MSELSIPGLSLVVLVGASSSGKSTFAAQHFGPYEVVSSDYCRGVLSNDPNDQSATKPAFELLHHIVGQRLAAGLLTVVDATNTQFAARHQLVELAKEHDVLPVAIAFDLPWNLLFERHQQRSDRPFDKAVIRRQAGQVRDCLPHLQHEGFRAVHRLTSPEQVAAATITRTRLFNDRRDDHGPFDVIGDVHGCLPELEALLSQLGYTITRDESGRPSDARHPTRRVIFLGDVIDRGPAVVDTLRLVMGMTAGGNALALLGNHEAKLLRALAGSKVSISHGLGDTLSALEGEGKGFTDDVRRWADGLVAHYVLDDGRLVVAHAGLKQAYQGRASARVRAFALYGETTGESDEFGLPVRYPWANDYRGSAMVLYGHTPVTTPQWVNNTLCIDTGAVFGGALTALRYPEKELVSVPAAAVYAEPVRPLGHGTASTSPDNGDGALDIADVTGKRSIVTRLLGNVTVQAEQMAGALESISRFAIAPTKLAYLPPTMSPAETSPLDGFLEHPGEAFAYFRHAGVDQVMCEEKHMGSRAVALVRRDGTGVLHTRTGRALFVPDDESRWTSRLAAAIEQAELWRELGADWVLLDAEALPWRLKAADLIDRQYAAVAQTAIGYFDAVTPALRQAAARGLDVAGLLARTAHRQADAAAFAEVVDRFGGGGRTQLAPFQVLAATGQTLYERPHSWHMDVATALSEADPEAIRPTRHLAVDLANAQAVAQATAWWEDLTAEGCEGMVVKPMVPTASARGIVQPGLKVRGREYLRLIYGPDYLDRLDTLRHRNVARKRSLAQREYALGLEAVDRFTAGEPLWRIHECVVAVLALESDPVDPRL